MLTDKQNHYLDTLELAADNIDSFYGEFMVGCCTALSAAAPNPGIGIDLVTLLMEVFEEPTHDLFWWPTTAEGVLPRIIALSLLMDIIETENLYAD